MTVVLVGFMGAGKSTVGRLVAQRLGVAFADSDDVIEERTGLTPREIFAASGEDYFRSVERSVVRDLVTGDDAFVVALGGGAVQDAGTRAVLGDATVVHLDVSFAQVMARVGDDPGRPVLARPDLPALYAARRSVYLEVADATVPTDGLTPDVVADRVLAALARLDA